MKDAMDRLARATAAAVPVYRALAEAEARRSVAMARKVRLRRKV